MKRPSSLTFLIGNPVSALAIFAGVAVVIWQWWHGRAADLAAVLAVFGLMVTMNASDQVTNYHHWKAEWDAMDGKVSGIRISAGVMRFWHVVIGLALWAAGAYGAMTLKPGPGTQIAVWCFWAGSALLLANLIYRMIRAIRTRQPARRPPADIAVAVATASVGRSPALSAAASAVPDYCRRLLSARRSFQ